MRWRIMADRKPKFWFTTSTGKHIPVFEGETKADALKRAVGSSSKSTAKSKTDTSVKSEKKTQASETKEKKAPKTKSKTKKHTADEVVNRFKKTGRISEKDATPEVIDRIESDKKKQQMEKASERSKKMNDEDKYQDSLKQGNKTTFKNGKIQFKGKDVQEFDTADALKEIKGDEKHAPKDNSLAKHLDKNGNLSDERKKIHAEIMQNYFNGVIEAKKDQKPVAHQPYAPGEKHVAMFTGGGGASGKGAFSKDISKYYSQNNNPMVIDPDALKSVLMKYDFPDRKSIDHELTGWYHEESSALAKQIYATALENDFPVMYDGTATGGGIFKLRDMAEAKGYSPEMNFIFSDWKTVRQNSLDRLEKSGRFVPPEQQLGAHQKAYSAVEKLQDKFDSFKLWDNAGRNMKLVGESSGRNKLKISNAESWNRFKTSADDFTLSQEEIDRFYDDADEISKKRKLAGL